MRGIIRKRDRRRRPQFPWHTRDTSGAWPILGRRLPRHLLAALAVAITVMSAGPALAQEVQVPVDEEGRTERIDAELARRLDFVADRYPGLQEMRLFQLPDGTYILEITSIEEGRTVRQREPITNAEVQILRSRVTAQLAESARTAIDREGRVELIAGSAIVGLGFYGWAVPEIFDVDNSRTAVALYMLTSAGTIAIPWIATRHAPVSEAMADLSFHGATRGIVRGLMLEWLLYGDEADRLPDDPVVEVDDSRTRRLTAAAATSLVEAVAGYWWARSAGMDRGTAYSAGNGSDFGMLAGAAAAGLIQPNDFNRNRLAPALVLAGAAIGAPIGARLAPVRDYSHGDAHLMRTAALLGISAGLMAVDLAGGDSERPIIAGATIGGVGGLLLGDRLVRTTDLAIGPARLIQLATVAGAAVGLGTAYLVSDDDWDDSPTAFLTLGTLGAGAAFGLTYRAFARDARPGTNQRSNLRIDVFPTGTFGGASPVPSSAGRPRLGATLHVQYRLP